MCKWTCLAKQHEHSYSHMYCYHLTLYRYVCDQKDMKDSRFTNAYAWQRSMNIAILTCIAIT